MSLVEVEHLTFSYGRHVALRDVSFRIPAGSVYALLGPNGSGKTTLLQVLMGLMPPTSGSVRVFGVPVSEHSTAHRARIGYVAEGLKLPNGMTLAQLSDMWRRSMPPGTLISRTRCANAFNSTRHASCARSRAVNI